MIQRIIDKQTKLFLRDDFAFNLEIEIGLEVKPAQGFYIPKWNGTSWEEGATQEYIDSLKPQLSEPTEAEPFKTMSRPEKDKLLETIEKMLGLIDAGLPEVEK